MQVFYLTLLVFGLAPTIHAASAEGSQSPNLTKTFPPAESNAALIFPVAATLQSFETHPFLHPPAITPDVLPRNLPVITTFLGQLGLPMAAGFVGDQANPTPFRDFINTRAGATFLNGANPADREDILVRLDFFLAVIVQTAYGEQRNGALLPSLTDFNSADAIAQTAVNLANDISAFVEHNDTAPLPSTTHKFLVTVGAPMAQALFGDFARGGPPTAEGTAFLQTPVGKAIVTLTGWDPYAGPVATDMASSRTFWWALCGYFAMGYQTLLYDGHALPTLGDYRLL